MSHDPRDRDLTAAPKGPAYFRGLDQAENPDAYDKYREDELPFRATLKDGIDRRSVLKLMGGAAVMAGLTLSGCRYVPQRKIVPFVRQPDGAISGATATYASSLELGGYGVGVLVQTADGRPVRLEGHPDHPASLGGLDARSMSVIATLFDPDRLKDATQLGEATSWTDALGEIHAALDESSGGSGVALLTETVGSPSFKAQIEAFLKKFPQAKWYQWESLNRDNPREGLKSVYGSDVHLVHDFSKADVIVSVDSNFMVEGPGALRFARDVSARRLPSAPGGMNRIYAVESVPTNTGVMADHRLRVKASAIPAFLSYLASKLGIGGANGALPQGVDAKKVEALLADLQSSGSKAVVVVGDHQAPEAHALAALINSKLGSTAVEVRAPVLARPTNQAAELRELTDAMASGSVRTLFMIGGNPVYTSFADLGFADKLAKVKLSVHLASERCETSEAAKYALPMSHPLESWGDTVAYEGTVAVRQPAIEPLYETKSEIEFLDLLVGKMRGGMEIVQETFKATVPNGDWTNFLGAGMPEAHPQEQPAVPAASQDASVLKIGPASSGMDLVFMPDPSLHDGRFANNGWMQELPRPMNHLVWDNALFMSYATAKKLNVGQPKTYGPTPIPYVGPADVVKVTVSGHTLEVPVYVNLGQADDTLALYLGGGRTKGGDVAVSGDEGHGGGFNANLIRLSTGPWVAKEAQVEATGKGYMLISTQYHNMLDSSRMDADRQIIFETTPAKLKAGKPFGDEGPERDWETGPRKPSATPPSFYNDAEFQNEENDAKNYQWAMTIDLSLCTGCNACVTACQAENNIPVVGKGQAKVHRAMHWIRIDRYFKGDWKDGKPNDSIDKDDPPVYFQPVTCMQCENAPCEPVCPVAATTHSHEGLNQMVYNRCVGTRYCSNNCPYKVRRFNFLDYTGKIYNTPVLRMLQNPEVTVRARGVMEKCTYCVQRIDKARQQTKIEGRLIKDGEVKTACQVACPTRAIVFGDKRIATTQVSKSRADARNYVLLEEVNTRPRTSYLCRVSNPNPALEAKA